MAGAEHFPTWVTEPSRGATSCHLYLHGPPPPVSLCHDHHLHHQPQVNFHFKQVGTSRRLEITSEFQHSLGGLILWGIWCTVWSVCSVDPPDCGTVHVCSYSGERTPVVHSTCTHCIRMGVEDGHVAPAPGSWCRRSVVLFKLSISGGEAAVAYLGHFAAWGPQIFSHLHMSKSFH